MLGYITQTQDSKSRGILKVIQVFIYVSVSKLVLSAKNI